MCTLPIFKEHAKLYKGVSLAHPCTHMFPHLHIRVKPLGAESRLKSNRNKLFLDLFILKTKFNYESSRAYCLGVLVCFVDIDFNM